MKQILSTCAILLLFTMANAQSSPIPSRIIGNSRYVKFTTIPNLVMTDSERYDYGSSNRGGDLDNPYPLSPDVHETLQFDSAHHIYTANTRVLSYYPDGKLLAVTYLEWDGTLYQNYSRDSLFYDANGNNTIQLELVWTAGQWQYNFVTIDSFDSNNHKVKRLQQQYTGGHWLNNALVNFRYNASGFELSDSTFIWNTGMSRWDNYSIFENTYDANNNKLTTTTYTSSGSNWVGNWREASQYDGNNNRTLLTRYNWGSGMWNMQERYISTYNAGNQITQSIHQTYGSAWQNSNAYLYTYHPDGTAATVIYQNWNGSDWVNTTQYLTTYNTDKFLLENKTQTWDGFVWVDKARTTDIRNVYNQRTLEREENYTSGAWTTTSERYYYYESYTPATGIDEAHPAAALKAYPNPFSLNTLITFENQTGGPVTFSIYNLTGALVQQQTTFFPAGNQQWLWNGADNTGLNVSAGAYIMQVKTSTGTQVQKLLKVQ